MIDPSLLVHPESETYPLPAPRRRARNRPQVESKGAVCYAMNNVETDTSESTTGAFPTNIVSAISGLSILDHNKNVRDTFVEPPMLQLDVQLKLDNSRLIKATIENTQKLAALQTPIIEMSPEATMPITPTTTGPEGEGEKIDPIARRDWID